MKFGDNSKKNMIIAAFVFAAIFTVTFVVVNLGTLWDAFSAVISVLSPILIGVAIAYILNPLLRFFEFKVFIKLKRKSLIRGLSILSTYISALILIAAFLWLLIPQIAESITDLISNYNSYVTSATDFINGILNELFSSGASKYVDETQIKEFVVNIFAESGNVLDAILDYVVEYGMGLFVGIKNTVLGIFISIYVLISKETLQAQVRKFGVAVFTESKSRKIGKYIALTHRTFSNFLVGKVLSSTLVGIITFIGMTIFGMPYALLISVIVGVTDIIPVFGPFIGAIPSFFIIFIVDPKKALIFAIMMVIIQQIEGNIITPKVLGESTGISSLAVIVSIIIMGEYFGFVGMIIGVPVFAVGINIVKELVDTKLKKKGKSTETSEYYLKDAMIDPDEVHLTVGVRLAKNVVRIAKKAAGLFVKKDKNDKSCDKTSAKEDAAEDRSEEQKTASCADSGDGDAAQNDGE